MKGIRFYQEFENKSRTKPTGNVIAAALRDDGNFSYWLDGKTAMVETMAAVFDRPNSPVVGTSASIDYLRQKCKRIPEAKARQIHPLLFERLDGDEEG